MGKYRYAAGKTLVKAGASSFPKFGLEKSYGGFWIFGEEQGRAGGREIQKREAVSCMGEKLRQNLAAVSAFCQVFFLWIIFAAVCGGVCGVVGAAFHSAVELAGELRAAHPWLLWCLPLAGLAVVGLYKLLKTEGLGTNDILDEVHLGKGIRPALLPSIFFGTFLTHLCGGSVGREGAALQMGGTIGLYISHFFRMDDRDRRTATQAGMAAFFTALFGTPVAATVFALLVVNVGRLYDAAMLPALAASLTAYGVSRFLGVAPTRFAVEVPAASPELLLRVAALAILGAFVSVLFCEVIHFTERRLARWMPNPWLRALAGGAAVVALTFLLGTTDYNGAGMPVITAAVEQGAARPEAFLLKLLLTALTLGAGFKGGEVVPSFFVGATFGAAAGPLLGLPAGFGAAIGLISVFCGATNCPLASILLAVELFGDRGILFYAVSCVLSFALSGYSGLYSSQTILYSKLKTRYINVKTNAHHMGEGGELDRDGD